MYQALYRKWRPRAFDDVVGQSHITDTLKRQVQEGRLSHAYLFTGTRGTGKTTCAKILARAVNCKHPVDGNPCNECEACKGIESGAVMDVLELDAASNNGVDQVRALRDEAVYSPAAVRKRVYIVDEVHMLSTAAFNALLKILEEPPQHLMFILATTELHKVPATIKSRCQQFAFKRISPLDIAQRLKFVAGEEHIPLTPAGADLLARLADGGMRDALSLLDQCATGTQNQLGETEILDALGLAGSVETAGLMAELAARNTEGALERLDRLYAAGKDVGSLLNELSSLTRDLLLRKVAPRGGAGLLTGGCDEQTLGSLDRAFTAPRLSQMLGRLQEASAMLGRSANRRVDAELCLIRLCDETLDDSPAGLTARISKLEEQMSGGEWKPVPVAPTAPPVKEKVEPVPSDPEDTPPWDMEPPPTVGADVPIGPRAAEDSRPYNAGTPSVVGAGHPAGPSAPESSQEVTKPAPTPSVAPTGDFWPGLAQALKGKVPMGEYSFLSNPTMVKGTAEGQVITLWAQNDFIRDMISQPGILALVEGEAASLLGGTWRVLAKTGQPPVQPPAGDRDKMDALLELEKQFGDIIVEE